MTVLDTYGCQGGAGMGYWLAGYDVFSVDNAPQPRNPFAFIQADAVAFIAEHGHLFDFIHASPPCQRYTRCQKIRGREHPDLIGPTRAALEGTGRPWVIENVEEARPELRDPVMLCGAAFGLRTYRHRLFEPGGGLTVVPPPHPDHVAPLAKMGRPVAGHEFMHVVGNFSDVPLARSEAVMGMPWASRDGLREAIPPAYTELIGRQAAAQIRTGSGEAAA
ncbi:DNA cytosine methyltransferase [Streptomyces sp. CB01881]|uniref:DNA cytosine methyltransferase n=1 Tax=Streptomyces sp. CB01881 TaxID=2078691 RepID=UPI000CDCB8DB|nr:DNA cytosine methyltransferase [Streptomyces sp. CB01881]AUY54349.1 SAM-dependent methyltransferase [Streptomyces sp. CB01881]TYC75252.1 DNA cytosine methyltransferase [Streptomyces sp. CB01881]